MKTKDFIINGIAGNMSIRFASVSLSPKSHKGDVMDPVGCYTFSGFALQLRN